MRVLLGWCAVAAILAGCVAIAEKQLDQRYGEQGVRERATSPAYRAQVQPILESRCVVCHGCYDAPCQLKLTSFEGLERGAHPDKVYDGTRLLTGELTRLYVDESGTEGWRKRGFFPVLNERNRGADLQGSVLARLLLLKREHPLPGQAVLPESFDFSLDRDQQCPRIEDFETYARDFPLWGMPYGLPALSEVEHQRLIDWMAQGAPAPEPDSLTVLEREEVAVWERFLNQNDGKARLMSRYVYEHLFLGALYFPNINETRFYEMVRSRTPPGEPIDLIASRRPFDDPGVERVYYRLRPRVESVLAKTHMPYALDAERMQRWREWFLSADYQLTQLPGYEPELAANPFVTFADLPVRSRYRFMLDEAHYTIMGFIKGPVCRGQVALNVINDHFWVVFLDPDRVDQEHDKSFLSEASKDLRLPAENPGGVLPLSSWLNYSQLERDWQRSKGKHLRERFPDHRGPDLDMLWDGDGDNPNAALTVLRHFDSATVVKGLVGEQPQTTWVVSYTLLERIHYLLVAGFDVYGTVGHQLLTRLYMDFLRMEGEQNFLVLLPEAQRQATLDHWYRGASEDTKAFVAGKWLGTPPATGVTYHSDDPLRELYAKIRDYQKPILDQRHALELQPVPPAITALLRRLNALPATAIAQLPQTMVLTLYEGDRRFLYTVLRNNAHLNVSSLFEESKRRVPAEDTILVVSGVLGAYPNQFLNVGTGEIAAFVEALEAIDSTQDYTAFLDAYGVRRSTPDFWAHSDEVHRAYRQQAGVESGWLDYNRLDNR